MQIREIEKLLFANCRVLAGQTGGLGTGRQLSTIQKWMGYAKNKLVRHRFQL